MDLKLRAPDSDQHSILLPGQASDLSSRFTGTLSSGNGREYKIEGNIADLMSTGHDYSIANWSNHLGVTAAVYEDIWRNRSIDIISGESFPIEKEKELLIDWLHPAPGNLYLDVGCSTALYARSVKRAERAATVVAIDISNAMLKEARKKAAEEATDLFLIRADARTMPFYAGMFDGLMMGGTLNELTDELKVLYECRRVIKKGGTFFMMHLLKADTIAGKLLQGPASWGGIKFWTQKQSNELFERAGFKVDDQFSVGIVCFSKLKAV
jgi:SAM-dependent methyltransferase